MDLSAPRSPMSALLLAGLSPGYPVEDLRVPEVTAAREVEVLRDCVPDVATALRAGTAYHLATYGIWGFALATSATVRDALAVGLRFVDLSFTLCDLAVLRDDGGVRLRLDAGDVPADVRDRVVARDLAGLATLAQELTGGALPLQSLRVRQAPSATSTWQEVVGRVPVFGAQVDEAVLDAALLDLPLPQADPRAAALTEAQCRALLDARRRRTGTAARVRDALLAAPGVLPSADDVAARLALSPRTLRRRLGEEGTSFRALTEEVRGGLAEELLQAGLRADEVSRRLGYADPSAFTRAFRRRHGVPPGTWSRRAVIVRDP